MTSPTPDPDPDRFDWEQAEAQLASTDSDGDPEAAPVLVDSPEAQRPERATLAGLRAAERRPILAPWLRSPREAREMAAWALGFAGYTSLYYLSRSPAAAGRLAARSPHGLARTLAGWRRWLFDAEGEPLRRVSADRADAETYLKLARQRDRRVRWRAFLTCVLVIVLAVAVVLLVVAPGWARLPVLAALVALLGRAGQPADRPLIQRAVVVPKAPRLTSEMVTEALRRLGISAITQALAKDPRAIGHVAPIHRDGPGWRAEIDLPLGVTAGEVVELREKLAANLRRPLGCVWPEGRPEVHPARLVLWVGDKDMAETRQPAWPLIKSGTVDLFRSFAFGTDQRGRMVPLTLMFASMAVGSLPRMGKTFAMRLALLAAALDLRAQVHAYDLKGTGDFSVLEPVAHRYRAGANQEDIAYLLADLRELQAEQHRRSKAIRELPRDKCPENKVTPELASMKSLRLHPIVVAIDECQRAFEHPEYGKEIEAICDDLVRVGPALAIMVMLGTQRPDKGSLPTRIRGNLVLRFCLKVMGQPENDMVLGTSAYKSGIQATMFTRSDKGIGYLLGEGDDPVIVRTYYVDAPAAERIVARARGMRERAGTLSGHALGEDPEVEAVASTNLLVDILGVWPTGEDRAWSEVLCARLAELRPDVYSGWDAVALGKVLGPLGVVTRQINKTADGQNVNRKGVYREEVSKALAARNDRRHQDPGESAE
jgi:DNA segregation ATPase FtsK/SpoIIIE, S-DNA-T family